MAPKGPYKLCTVNTVPERAKLVVGRFIESVKESYIIIYVENASSTSFLLLQTGYAQSCWRALIH
jgi:hypothetical protein